MKQQELVPIFRQLHQQSALVLPNAWDAGSAKIIEGAGALAIGTTSAGVSWSHGRGDGEGIPRSQAVETIRSIVETVDIPVTADIEGGYGTASDVRETVRMVLDAGVVGINLEDSPGLGREALLPPEVQAERIREAREAGLTAGVEVFINARIDEYLLNHGESSGLCERVLRRAARYLEAGADGIFVPGVSDSETIIALVEGINAPLNIMAGPGGLSVDELVRLGVRRISLGPAIALGAFSFIEKAAREALQQGTFRILEKGLSYQDMNGLFDHD